MNAIHATLTMVTIHATCRQPTALCPQCQQASDRVHSCYERVVADVPCGGRQVRLLLTVRKFVCRTSMCAQRIFTERVPDFVLPSARLTNRLREALEALGFATCGEVGARLAPKLGMHATPSTLLRRMRAVSFSAESQRVRILGVDDWAWKKGQTYGTMLVDLEGHRVIGFLPDRETETFGDWLRAHPEVEIVSRDRATTYADAVKRHAPQAQQVADRFHLLKNLREKLKEVIQHKHTCLPRMQESREDGIPQAARSEACSFVESSCVEGPLSAELRGSPPQPAAERRKQERRSRRVALYQEMVALRKLGDSYRTIAHKLGVCPRTVRRFVTAEGYPDLNPWPRRGSILDPYKPYLLQQLERGGRAGPQLYREIQERGYTGSCSQLRLFLASVRPEQCAPQETTTYGPPLHKPARHHTRRMSASYASWLLVNRPKKLTKKQCQQLERVRTAHSDWELAYQVSQAFVTLLAEQRAEDLEPWLQRAEQCGIAALQGFAHSLRREYAAVLAAVSLPWSQGQVEGQINRLKLQKRLMFGRGNFDLLQQRVLYRA